MNEPKLHRSYIRELHHAMLARLPRDTLSQKLTVGFANDAEHIFPWSKCYRKIAARDDKDHIVRLSVYWSDPNMPIPCYEKPTLPHHVSHGRCVLVMPYSSSTSECGHQHGCFLRIGGVLSSGQLPPSSPARYELRSENELTNLIHEFIVARRSDVCIANFRNTVPLLTQYRKCPQVVAEQSERLRIASRKVSMPF